MFRRFSESRVVSWLLLFVMAVVALHPNIGQADTQLGSLTFIKAQSQSIPLDVGSFIRRPSLAESLKSHDFLSNVGGVAFGGIAVTSAGVKIVDLRYDSKQPDGQRLVVILEENQQSINVNTRDLFDWQLVPIARFAAKDDFACATLFGHLADEQEEHERKSRGEHIIGYHSALQNTLLGWRLFHADLLIIRPDACDLPRDEGKYILGAGEHRWLLPSGVPDVDKNRKAFSEVSRLLSNAKPKFTSYVVCDHEQKIAVDYHKKTLELTMTGNPQWYCWRRKIDDEKTQIDLQKKANARANEILNSEFQRDQQEMSREEFDKKWSRKFQEERFRYIFDDHISANLIQPLPSLSKMVSQKMRDLEGINPVVYSSLVTTMRYAALFRSVRQQDQGAYQRFIESLREVPVLPAIETPTVMIEAPGTVRTRQPRRTPRE